MHEETTDHDNIYGLHTWHRMLISPLKFKPRKKRNLEPGVHGQHGIIRPLGPVAYVVCTLGVERSK